MVIVMLLVGTCTARVHVLTAPGSGLTLVRVYEDFGHEELGAPLRVPALDAAQHNSNQRHASVGSIITGCH